MQQIGPQFMQSSGYGPGAQAAAPTGLPQPQPFAQPYTYPTPAAAPVAAQPYAQSYAQPSPAAQPYAQSYAQPSPAPQPYAQSYTQPSPAAQPYAQSYTQPSPAAQPYAQSYAQPSPAAQPYAQSYAQPSPAAQPAAQSYPPPVPPPSGAAPVTQSQPLSPQQSAQQAHVRLAVGIARNLEQIIPGYQLAISLVEDLSQNPKAQTLPSAHSLRDTLQDAAFYHFATLGALRRFLCGESTPELISALAVAINHLAKIHTVLRSQTVELVAAAPAEIRSALAKLTQAFGTADAPLQQAVSAVQSNVSAQVWEAARAKSLAKAASETQPEASV